MADLKISQLTNATTPLAGTETLPIVQSGATKKVSVANLTAGRAVATAGGSFTDNLVQGTAGKGVNFTANTPAAGMTSQLLNWYEEGTYTVTITPGTSGSVTLKSASDTLQYTRIGRQVTVSGFLDVNSVSSPVGYAAINLPFAINDLTENAGRSVGTVMMDGTVSVAPNGFHAIGIEGTSEMRVYVSNSGTALSATGANQIQANTAIWINFTYVA